MSPYLRSASTRVAEAHLMRLAVESKADVLRAITRWRSWERLGASRQFTLTLANERKMVYGLVPHAGKVYATLRAYHNGDKGGNRVFVTPTGDTTTSTFGATLYEDEGAAVQAILRHAEASINRYKLSILPTSSWSKVRDFFSMPSLNAPGPVLGR